MSGPAVQGGPEAGPESSEARGRVARGRSAMIAAALACVVAGVAVATLPHAIARARSGDFVWIADEDEILYLQFAGQAYDNHPWSLADPVLTTPTGNPHSRIALLPGILIARALGLGPFGIGLAWRAWSGLLMALVSFALMSHFVRRPWVAAGLTIVLLADPGVLSGHLVIKPARLAYHVLAGLPDATLDGGIPMVHNEWRIVNPGTTLPYLLAFLWLLVRARERPTAARIGLAGAAYGLLYAIYFYYWTAASVGLALAWALDAGRRRVYFHVAWIGVLIGMPALLASVRFKNATLPDWLQRSNKFLPIPRFSGLLLPKVGGAILAAGLAWAWARRRRIDLMPVATLGLAGLILTNHQVISGLEIENFHWGFVWGPIVSWLIVLIAADALGLVARRPEEETLAEADSPTGATPRPTRAPAWPAVVVGVLATATLGVGLWLRAVEAERTRGTVELMAQYARYRDQRREPGAAALTPNAVTAGDPAFVKFVSIGENQRMLEGYSVQMSPYVSDDEWDERAALNGLLRGLDAPGFEAEERAAFARTHWGPWASDPALREGRIAHRLAAFARFAADPAAAAERFRVRYVALPAGGPAPAYLGQGWRKVEAGPSWQIWEHAGT